MPIEVMSVFIIQLGANIANQIGTAFILAQANLNPWKRISCYPVQSMVKSVYLVFTGIIII